MDKPHHQLTNAAYRPPKILALLALFIAIILPFLLIKFFPEQRKATLHTKFTLSSIPSIPKLTETHLSTKTSLASTMTSSSSYTHHASSIFNQISPINIYKKTPITKKPSPSWQTITVRNQDSLANIFTRAGISAKILHTVMKDTQCAKAFQHLRPGQTVKLLIYQQSLEEMIFPYSLNQDLVITRGKQDGHYQSHFRTREVQSYHHFLSATVTGSLYTTAKKYRIPAKLIHQMTKIFTWNINFAKDIKKGDTLSLVYTANYLNNKLVQIGDIVAVTYHTKGKSWQAIRHINKNGQTNYYTPDGHSLEKAFNRYPIHFSHVSSTFSLSRYHPVLHYRRPHKGIDLAAQMGTPIYATGDGKIAFIGRQNGYGNVVKITHNKLYSTLYGHMLKFQPGLNRGSWIKRGQIIGYVGQSGLASGPHCHYEFHINEHPKNPATVKLPQATSLKGTELAHFKESSMTLLTQLKVFESAHLASLKIAKLSSSA